VRTPKRGRESAEGTNGKWQSKKSVPLLNVGSGAELRQLYIYSRIDMCARRGKNVIWNQYAARIKIPHTFFSHQTAKEFFSHRHISAENIIQANLTNAAAVFLLIQIPWVRGGDSSRIGFALFTIGELISNCSLTYQYYARRKLLKKPCPPTFCRRDFFVSFSLRPALKRRRRFLLNPFGVCAPLDLLVFLQAIELTEQTFFAAKTNGRGTYFNEFDLHLFWIPSQLQSHAVVM